MNCKNCGKKIAQKLAVDDKKGNYYCSVWCLAEDVPLTKSNKEDINMAQKLSDYAKAYESSTTKNIADLPEVSTELELSDDQFETVDKKTNQPKTVKQKVVCINNVNYRVPVSVFEQLKIVLEDNPNLKKFKVKKSGAGMETKYQVIPLI